MISYINYHIEFLYMNEGKHIKCTSTDTDLQSIRNKSNFEYNLLASLKQKTARRDIYFYFLSTSHPNEKARKSTPPMDGEEV